MNNCLAVGVWTINPEVCGPNPCPLLLALKILDNKIQPQLPVCSDKYIKQSNFVRSGISESVTGMSSFDKKLSCSLSKISACLQSRRKICKLRFCCNMFCLLSHIFRRSFQPSSSAFSLCSTAQSKLHQFRRSTPSSNWPSDFSSFAKFTKKQQLSLCHEYLPEQPRII